MEVALAKTLIAVGRLDEGDALFRRLAAASENSSEIAYDAGRALHLGIKLDQAVSWYVRGIGTSGRIGDGKSKHEYIQAIVFALAEKGAWDEAVAHIDRFRTAYVRSDYDWVAMYREFVRWRTGGIRASRRCGSSITPRISAIIGISSFEMRTSRMRMSCFV